MSFDLFQLVPAVYRNRDALIAQQLSAITPFLTPAEQAQLSSLQALQSLGPLSPQDQLTYDALTAKATRGPLQSLLMLVQEQIEVLAEDLDQLYDDHFIETCAPWVIPYIGDLIGYQSIAGIAESVDDPRVEVAETISLRRRKGTVLVLEQLARDVTGWGAHAVEFFTGLGATQNVKHIRPQSHFAPNMRRWQHGIYVDTGFDTAAHRVDVRRIESRRGRYNLPNVGIFLWSLGANSVTAATPASLTPVTATIAASEPLCFRFSQLGMDIPLFHRAVSQGEQITAPASPTNVPDRLRRRVLCADLAQGVASTFYGLGNSLVLQLNGQYLDPYQLQIANLSGSDGSWSNLPSASSPYAAVIDPELGRFALPAAAVGSAWPDLQVSYYYGFNGDSGGGEYSREATFVVTNPEFIYPFPDTSSPQRYTTLQAAIEFAIAQMATEGQVAVEVAGSVVLPAFGSPAADALELSVNLPAGTTLELRAAEGARPTLFLNAELTVTGAALSTFILNGFVIAAASTIPAGTTALVHAPQFLSDGVTANALDQLTIAHTTLVPGWSVNSSGIPLFPSNPALVAEPPELEVSIERSIVGVLQTASLVTLSVSDSIVDATSTSGVAYSALDGSSGGGALTLQGCTVVGKVHATLLSLVSNSILWAALAEGDTWASALIADRKQQGCVRFSFLPVAPIIPRSFQCVVQALASPMPLFFSTRYGQPGYLKMLVSTDNSIRSGADDNGEMGAFHYLLAPQRDSDLNTRLLEYLPVGLEAGLIYQS